MKNIFLIFCSLLVCTASAQQPDIIMYNGKIFTANERKLYVTALAIQGEKILAVGPDQSILLLKAANTKLVDLQGKTVLPGFNDAHTHPGPEYPARHMQLQRMPEEPTPWPIVRDSILSIVGQVPVGTLIRADINPALFADADARLRNLDSIAPLHPVILSSWTGHGKLLNSKAMQLMGYEKQTIFAGGWFEKDPGGELTGIVHEYASYPLNAQLTGKMSTAQASAHLQKYYQEALAMGITSHQVMATQMEAARFAEIYKGYDFGARNRIIAFPFTNDRGLLLEEWQPLFGKFNTKNECSGIKLILDGTPIERLAYLTQGYSDEPLAMGHLDFDEKNIVRFIAFALQQRQQIMVHAVGDAAVKTFLRLLRSMHPEAFWKDKRVRIEHGDLAVMEQADLQSMARMGIVLVQNPMHFTLVPTMNARLGGRTKYLQAMRSILNNNIPLALGSDGPNNPFLNIMMAAIHPVNPGEAITVEDAVIAYTRGAAFAEFRENEKGMLAPGLFADLIVVSQDIFSIPVNALPGTRVLSTMVGGKILYQADK